MTREDRKSKNAINYPASVLTWLNEVTDSIYDDFESRTCENCKHYSRHGDRYIEFFDCTVLDGIVAIVDRPPKDFGCNKFERRM